MATDVLEGEGPEPIEARRYRAYALMGRYAPRPQNPNKRVVFGISCPPGARYGGVVTYLRWAEMPIPERVRPAAAADLALMREGFYDYVPLPGAGSSTGAAQVVEWHVHFADPTLFGLYGTAVFVQDEWQVVEHPALAALKEALEMAGRPGGPWSEAGPRRSS